MSFATVLCLFPEKHCLRAHVKITGNGLQLVASYFTVKSTDSAVGRGDGQCSARRFCRGLEFDSRCGS